jgi:hypothetical protein
LTRFLIELSENPVKRHLFENDPETAMKAAGLTAIDRKLVRARDASQLRAHYGVKTLAHMTCVIPGTIPSFEEALACVLRIQSDLSGIAALLQQHVDARARTYPPRKKKPSAKKKPSK